MILYHVGEKCTSRSVDPFTPWKFTWLSRSVVLSPSLTSRHCPCRIILMSLRSVEFPAVCIESSEVQSCAAVRKHNEGRSKKNARMSALQRGYELRWLLWSQNVSAQSELLSPLHLRGTPYVHHAFRRSRFNLSLISYTNSRTPEIKKSPNKQFPYFP